MAVFLLIFVVRVSDLCNNAICSIWLKTVGLCINNVIHTFHILLRTIHICDPIFYYLCLFLVIFAVFRYVAVIVIIAYVRCKYRLKRSRRRRAFYNGRNDRLDCLCECVCYVYSIISVVLKYRPVAHIVTIVCLWRKYRICFVVFLNVDFINVYLLCIFVYREDIYKCE